MDEEEEEMKHNIRNGSADQVDAISDSRKQVDVIGNSKKQVDAKSEKKANMDYNFRNDFKTMNVEEKERQE